MRKLLLPSQNIISSVNTMVFARREKSKTRAPSSKGVFDTALINLAANTITKSKSTINRPLGITIFGLGYHQ